MLAGMLGRPGCHHPLNQMAPPSAPAAPVIMASSWYGTHSLSVVELVYEGRRAARSVPGTSTEDDESPEGQLPGEAARLWQGLISSTADTVLISATIG